MAKEGRTQEEETDSKDPLPQQTSLDTMVRILWNLEFTSLQLEFFVHPSMSSGSDRRSDGSLYPALPVFLHYREFCTRFWRRTKNAKECNPFTYMESIVALWIR
jgi:hypothetical protein